MEDKICLNKIRGVCHNPDFNKTWAQMDFELECARRLNINSIRFWLDESEWKKEGKKYIDNIEKFVQLCEKYSMTVMPILWNGNYITQFSEPNCEQWIERKKYLCAVVKGLSQCRNIIIWDVINEPMWNDYLRRASEKEYVIRYKILKKYIRELCELVKSEFPELIITVGHEQVQHCESTVDLVDVISFHDYHCTRAEMQCAYEQAIKLSDKNFGKPVLNTETGCIGRANPYDVELEMCQKYNLGWYLFNLVIEDNWGDIHGLIYQDGTIRDPAIIAYLLGFKRNKNSKRIKSNPNREGHVYLAIEKVKKALKDEEESLFVNKRKDVEEILSAAEYCVNILEACEMVAMDNPPSDQIQLWREKDESEINIEEVKKFAYRMAQILMEKCCVL